MRYNPRCERRPGAYWDPANCQCKGDPRLTFSLSPDKPVKLDKITTNTETAMMSIKLSPAQHLQNIVGLLLVWMDDLTQVTA